MEKTKINRAIYAGIIKKLQAGKSLNATDQKFVAEYDAADAPDEKRGTKRTVEITQSDLERSGLSRVFVREKLATLTPIRVQGRSKYYELINVLAVVMGTDEDYKLADLKAAAELKQEKLRRMKAESVDAMEVEALFCDIFKRLADAIKAWDWLPIKARRAICDQIRSEIERCGGDVAKCRFKIANPEA